MALTIDCGEGRHAVCSGSGTERYLIPQLDDAGRFDCACSCHGVATKSRAVGASIYRSKQHRDMPLPMTLDGRNAVSADEPEAAEIIADPALLSPLAPNWPLAKEAPAVRRPIRCRLFGHRMRYERGDALIAYMRCSRCDAWEARPLSFVAVSGEDKTP